VWVAAQELPVRRQEDFLEHLDESPSPFLGGCAEAVGYEYLFELRAYTQRGVERC
jgi:hypothetical protein